MMQIRPKMERRQGWREKKDQTYKEAGPMMQRMRAKERWRLVGPKAMQRSKTKGCADKQVIKNEYGYKWA